MAERLTQYLRSRVLALPLADRVELLDALRGSIKAPERVNRDARLAYLADKMREVSGVDVRICNNRTARACWPRYMFCFVARREGYPQARIGAFICRDHSTICAAERRVKDAFSLPEQYADEIELYNKFVNAL